MWKDTLFGDDGHDLTFKFLMPVKYQTIAANPRLAGMISLYEATYRAAYKEACAAAVSAAGKT